MPSASANFTVGSPQQQMASVAPSVGGAINTNANLNYPTYVPVTVPAPIPSKEAAITNVTMPQQVLPGATFSIIVTVTTYVAGTINYTVTLQIPQLSLTQTSIPMTLSNNAVGTTTFNVSLPITARGLTASGNVTGQLTLQDTTNNQTVDGVPLNFTIAGTSIPTPIGVVPAPVQPIPLGPVGRPVIGAVPYGPGALPVRYGYQGYVFGQGSGQQRHQWDFMPHTITPQMRYAYQAGLGPLCPDGKHAAGDGLCSDGLSPTDPRPISTPPPPVIPAPVPTPVPVTPTPAPLVPTSTDSGLPAVTPTPVPTPAPVVTPTSTPTPTPPVTTVTPAVVDNDDGNRTRFLGPPVPANMPPRPTTHNPQDWRNWEQQFRASLEQQLRDRTSAERGRGWSFGRNSGWAFHRGGGRQGYQATISMAPSSQSQPQQPQSAVILTTILPNGILHLDAHGFQPMEQVTVDLNIPMSRISRTANLVTDISGHLAHDYRLSKPPNKQYIAALRVTGQSSNKVGFRTITI